MTPEHHNIHSDKLNILIMLHWMKVDGSGIYYSRLAKKLSERGHKVIVASTGGPLAKELQDNGIKHHRFTVLDLNYWPVYRCIFEIASSIKFAIGRRPHTVTDLEGYPSFTKALKYLLRKRSFFFLWVCSLVRLFLLIKKEHIDIIESHSIGAIPLAFLCSRVIKIPFFVRVSAPHFTALPRFMFRYIYRAAGGIIAVSRECVNYMTGDCQSAKSKIRIMHNLVDIQRFRQFSEDEKVYYEGKLIRQGLDISRNRHKIALVSRLDKDKETSIVSTIRSIAEVAKIMPDIQLIVVGDGDIFDKVYELAEEVNRKRGEQIIVMAGYLDQVERILNLADIVVAIGGAAVEAMACGKPVIVAGHRTGPKGGSFGGIITPATLKELRDYYFTGRNSSQKTTPALIAQECLKLLGDEAWRNELGEFGRRFVTEECNLEKSVDRIEKMFFEAIGDYV